MLQSLKSRQEELENDMGLVLLKVAENCRRIHQGEQAREQNAALWSKLAELTAEYAALQPEPAC